jgi:hypothetical protein
MTRLKYVLLAVALVTGEGTAVSGSGGFGPAAFGEEASHAVLQKLAGGDELDQPPDSPGTIIWHGDFKSCQADNDFGGHLPKQFTKCRGAGTGVGFCFAKTDHRVVFYEVPMSGCRLTMITGKEAAKLRHQYRSSIPK